MPFVRVNPGDPLQAHQLDQVIDALSGAAGAGVPIALTAVNDALNYALTVQNDETGNSRALNVLKSDGTLLIRADVTGVTLGSPLHIPASSIGSTEIADASVANVDLGPDVARANLLVNGGFDIWSRGAIPPGGTASGAYSADRWLCTTGTSSSFSVMQQTNATVDAASQFALALACSISGESFVFQKLEDVSQLRGRTVSFSIRVNTATANAVRPFLQTSGPVNTFGAFHPGGSTWQTLTVTLAVPAGTTILLAGVALDVSCTAYLDNAMLVAGSQPANYVPLHPADELARCLRYYETIGSISAIVGSGQAYSTTQAFGALSWKAKKAVTPTLTSSVPGNYSVTNTAGGPVQCSALALSGGSLDGFRWDATASSAAFSGGGNATNLNVGGSGVPIVGEANP